MKSQPERRDEFDAVLAGQLLAHFVELRIVANDQSEVPHAAGVRLFCFKHGEKLVFADFEEGVAFALVELLEIEDVLIKGDRFLDVVYLDGDVIDAVYLDAHIRHYPRGSAMVTCVPAPGRLSRAIVPPLRSTARCAMESPKPLPSVVPFESPR